MTAILSSSPGLSDILTPVELRGRLGFLRRRALGRLPDWMSTQ